MRWSKSAGAALCVAAFAAVMSLYAWQAAVTPTFAFDEALWFMRSQVSPADISTAQHRFWATDIPAVNRWCWYGVLKVTGLDAVPPGEPEAWHLVDGVLYFYQWRLPLNLQPQLTMEEWHKQNGTYAPRRAIVAMRMVNLSFFGMLLVCLGLTARTALGSWPRAALAAAPIAIIPLFAARHAFASTSGDIQFLAATGAVLALWVRFHLRGTSGSLAQVVMISLVAGLAVSSKHTGLFALLAYAAYLVAYSRGWRRIVNPLVAVAVAFAVFAAVNPVVFLDPAGPISVCRAMIERRYAVTSMFLAGRDEMTWADFLKETLFWWPMLPALAYVIWRARKYAWFPPVALWSGTLVAGTLCALAYAGMLRANYIAPIDLGLYFSAALAAMAAAGESGRSEPMPKVGGPSPGAEDAR